MTGESAATGLLWFAALALAFTYAGYPALIDLLARWRSLPAPPPPPPSWPSVDCVVVAHNEAHQISDRLRNLLDADYPPEKLRVILVCDGSTDATAAVARRVGDPRLQILQLPARQGKASGLNAALAVASAELVVLADARQRFARDALQALARHFSDPKVGAVSGNYLLQPPADGVGAGVDAYWQLEKFIRLSESRFDSTIGCTGAIYALRRAAFTPLPPDTILDDVIIPMRLAAAGYRVLFEPSALAWETVPVTSHREFIRKQRTLAGNWQMFFRHPEWLLPWRHRLWWQLLCHKYLRLFAPLWLLIALTANLALACHPFYRATLLAQVLFYALAGAGMLFPQLKSRWFTLPAGFLFLNAAVIAGLWHFWRRPASGAWDRTPAAPSHVQSPG